jgi:hypothetical protein
MWTDARFAGGDRLYVSAPRDAYMRVPDIILKCVVFLGQDTEHGRRYKGTGYVVINYHPEKSFLFLVTAAHVAEELDGFDFYIRANHRDGRVVELTQKCEQSLWWYHPTERESVDVAAMAIPFQEILELDLQPIPVPMFINEATIKSKNIGVGDEVFVAGLFTNAKGTSKQLPIIRIGNVAMMPEEKIFFPTDDKPDQWLYANLLESRSIGGLSGSPVFIRETVRIDTSSHSGGRMRVATAREESGEPTEIAGVGRFHFFGSMVGHWQIPLPAEFSRTQLEAVNMGIAPMVPAHKILEVLTQPELSRMMDQLVNAAKERRKQEDGVATLDSASNPKERPLTKEAFEDALKKASRKITPDKK